MSDKRNAYNLPSGMHSLASGNGNGYKQLSAPQNDANYSDKRKTTLKFAAFYLMIAFALIIADALGRMDKHPDSASDHYSIADVTLVVHPHSGSRGVLRVAFRLSNMGKHAVFYGVRPETNFPIGEILVRDATSSEWTDQSGVLGKQQPAVPDSRVTWIEMPPGGWIDGEIEDRIGSPGYHVCAVFLELDRDGPIVRVTSAPYRDNRE